MNYAKCSKKFKIKISVFANNIESKTFKYQTTVTSMKSTNRKLVLFWVIYLKTDSNNGMKSSPVFCVRMWMYFSEVGNSPLPNNAFVCKQWGTPRSYILVVLCGRGEGNNKIRRNGLLFSSMHRLLLIPPLPLFTSFDSRRLSGSQVPPTRCCVLFNKLPF